MKKLVVFIFVISLLTVLGMTQTKTAALEEALIITPDNQALVDEQQVLPEEAYDIKESATLGGDLVLMLVP